MLRAGAVRTATTPTRTASPANTNQARRHRVRPTRTDVGTRVREWVPAAVEVTFAVGASGMVLGLAAPVALPDRRLRSGQHPDQEVR